MPSIRFRLDKPTLNGLAQRVAAEYGPEARIVDTEERVLGGIGGLFGKRVIDVTVEVPDRAAPEGAHEFSMRSRVGLAALLEDADAADLGPATAHGSDPWAAAAAVPEPVSTQRGDFASVLDALRIDVEPAGEAGGGTPARRRAVVEPPLTPTAFAPIVRQEPLVAEPRRAPARTEPRRALDAPAVVPPVRRPQAQRPIASLPPAGEPTEAEVAAAEAFVWATPTPRSRMGRTTPGTPPPQRTRSGDLLLLVGLGDDPVRVANALRDRLQKGYVCDGGLIEGNTRRRVDDRRGAVAARAYGVRSEQPVIVAYGVDERGLADAAGLLSIDSDQAWLVVDATRDEQETLAWTGRLRGRLQVDAVASVRADRGATPSALPAIGLPEAWRELAG